MPIGLLLLQHFCVHVQCMFFCYRIDLPRNAWWSALAFEELIQLARLLLFCNRIDFGCRYGSFYVSGFDWETIGSDRSKLDFPGVFSILVIAAIVVTTIQAQDFQDVIGDKAVGRYTLPIAFPNFSRYTPFITLVVWSLFLTAIWEVTILAGACFTLLGIIVGIRYYFLRSTKDDESSYLLYSVSLLSLNYLHLLTGPLFRSGWQLPLWYLVIGACTERKLYNDGLDISSQYSV